MLKFNNTKIFLNTIGAKFIVGDTQNVDNGLVSLPPDTK